MVPKIFSNGRKKINNVFQFYLELQEINWQYKPRVCLRKEDFLNWTYSIRFKDSLESGNSKMDNVSTIMA